MWAAYVLYPADRAKNGHVNTLAERLRGCFRFSMNGKPPAADDPVLTALQTYMFWLASKAPTGVALKGQGYLKPVSYTHLDVYKRQVLGLIARQGRAGLPEFDAALDDPAVADFRGRVTMELDPEVDGAYPQRWIGKVTVHTRDGRVLHGRVDEPKGDPGNTLSRDEIETKTLSLGRYADAATEAELRALIGAIWNLERADKVGALLP